MARQMDEKYKLSVCIPNYDRMDRLDSLLRNLAGQITVNGLHEEIEICVSDDCSEADPVVIVKKIREAFDTINIRYERNKQNMGMDYNFLHSVLIAQGQYAWIVGNDDVPEDGALSRILATIDRENYKDVDIIVTPFDSFDYDNNYVKTVYPLGTVEGDILFDTSDKEQWHKLVMSVQDNSAVFGFLSNVVFKRKRWVEHGGMFANKMSSIFIQVYMNMQTLAEGAKYLYTPEKFIINYLDDETNQTIDRTYRIAAGLYDAMDYFFDGEEKRHIQKNVVDIFISSRFMEFPENDARKIKVNDFVSERMDIIKQYYVRIADRRQYFGGRTVIVYGAGNFGHMAVNDLMQYETEIIGICDADIKKHGRYIGGKVVFGFEQLLREYGSRDNCMVVVANNLHLVQIVNMLRENRISRIAIIT